MSELASHLELRLDLISAVDGPSLDIRKPRSLFNLVRLVHLLQVKW